MTGRDGRVIGLVSRAIRLAGGGTGRDGGAIRRVRRRTGFAGRGIRRVGRGTGLPGRGVGTPGRAAAASTPTFHPAPLLHERATLLVPPPAPLPPRTALEHASNGGHPRRGNALRVPSVCVSSPADRVIRTFLPARRRLRRAPRRSLRGCEPGGREGAPHRQRRRSTAWRFLSFTLRPGAHPPPW
jgi:hypothetical protein